jgi:predicted transcriptional regulator
MLNRIVLFLACFFAILSGVLLGVNKYQSKRIDTLETARTSLEANNQLLISKMKRAYDDKVELGRKNQELESLAKRSVGFDWNRDISSDELVLWLHENAVRVQRDRARAD